jgi:hypothetical protein
MDKNDDGFSLPIAVTIIMLPMIAGAVFAVMYSGWVDSEAQALYSEARESYLAWAEIDVPDKLDGHEDILNFIRDTIGQREYYEAKAQLGSVYSDTIGNANESKFYAFVGGVIGSTVLSVLIGLKIKIRLD